MDLFASCFDPIVPIIMGVNKPLKILKEYNIVPAPITIMIDLDTKNKEKILIAPDLE